MKFELECHPIDYNAIGRRIRYYRKEMNITQQVLAERSFQEPSNISHIERGATKLGLPTIIYIANALDVTVDQLLCDSLKKSEGIYQNELLDLLSDCSQAELRIICETSKALKENLRYSKKPNAY